MSGFGFKFGQTARFFLAKDASRLSKGSQLYPSNWKMREIVAIVLPIATAGRITAV